MKITFARDEEGNIKTKKPCQTPGCNWPNWHVCLVGKPDTTRAILAKQARKPRRNSYVFSEEHRQISSENLKLRWERFREIHRTRDEAMVQAYIDGAGINKLRSDFGLGYRAVTTVLRRAENNGLIKVRKQGERPIPGFFQYQ